MLLACFRSVVCGRTVPKFIPRRVFHLFFLLPCFFNHISILNNRLGGRAWYWSQLQVTLSNWGVLLAFVAQSSNQSYSLLFGARSTWFFFIFRSSVFPLISAWKPSMFCLSLFHMLLRAAQSSATHDVLTLLYLFPAYLTRAYGSTSEFLDVGDSVPYILSRDSGCQSIAILTLPSNVQPAHM